MGNSLVSKIASENRTQHQRSQKSDFLKTQDIQRLYHELGCEMKIYMEPLLISFDKTKWMMLTKATLVHIMVFNRRRPGDVEKSQLTEYATLQTVPSECLEMIDDKKKRLAMTYGRYITRGKLNSPSPLLVSDIDMSAIKVILKYRRDAKVEDNNPYLFAQPAGTATRFVSAGLAPKEFCLQKGLHNVNVTATKMRKHLATVTGNLEHEKVNMVILLNAIGEESSTSNQNKELIRIEPCYENQLRDDINRLSDSENNIQLPIASEGYVTPQESDDDVDTISYEPDLSTITEVDTSQEDTSNICMKQKPEKKIKSVQQSRYGMRRIGTKFTWTTPERKEARRMFKRYLERSNDIPSLETCEEFKSNSDALSGRSSVQIRAWIRAEQKRISNRDSNKTCSEWTTPTKKLCRERFKNFYKTHIYPDYSELQDAIDTEPLLSDTTTIKLRSHLQHDYKYVEKKEKSMKISNSYVQINVFLLGYFLLKY
ncbi:hypothetical protein NQ317_002528 [Molorchus minor]|uniref:Uncharacterized protein n=1 Tax=Molorchus minor TaxID=1323400 RepID=A0ABQ9IV61_9CUCU|nr:hypothetical protein NQ317_002528 [Molorchus minor]